MRILLTGAGGALGRRLADQLQGEVWRAFRSQGQATGAPAESHTVAFDLTDAGETRRAVAQVRPDCVVHLAAYIDVQGSVADPLRAWQTNLAGTLHLLEGLRKEGLKPRFLLASTAQVYGPPPTGGGPISESHLPRPVNPYAASKLAAEHAALVFHRQYGFETIVARVFNVVGTGQTSSSVSAVLARRVASIVAAKAKPPMMAGNLESIRDFIPMADALGGISSALRAGRAGEIYNVCTGKGTSVRELLETLFEIAGRKIPVETDAKLLRAADPDRVVGDPSKLEQATGFCAQGNIRPALAELYEASLVELRGEALAGAS